METPGKQFRSPEEEIAYLKAEIARREAELLGRNKEIDATDIETLGKDVLADYGEHDPSLILHADHAMSAHEIHSNTELVSGTQHQYDELMKLTQERGIRNVLTVLEKVGSPFLVDEVHSGIIEMLRQGSTIADLKEGVPLWNILHMTLFEVSLPRHKEENGTAQDIKHIFAAMEQFYAGMATIAHGKSPKHYAIEIAVSDKRDDIILYVAVPNEFVNLFEKHALSLFPHAVLHMLQNDYNIFVDGGVSHIAVGREYKHAVYPLKMHDEFTADPLSVLLNAFSKIERDGGGAAIQMIIEGGSSKYREMYQGIIKRLEKGDPKDVAIRKSTFTGSMFEELKTIVSTPSDKKDEKPKDIDNKLIEVLRKKIETPILSTNIRIAVSAMSDMRASQIMTEIESSFNQFQNVEGNMLSFSRLTGGKKDRELKAFSFREYDSGNAVPLSIRELATLMHFPSEGIESTPQFKQSRSKRAPAPLDMPQNGLLLGENEFRNMKTKIYLPPEDRLRHLYVIGQTGTGKSGFLQSLAIQDIQNGEGVCFIDPHGKDVLEILASVPPERADDLIYFDPSRMDRVIGLNMLEFDPRYPEQKTFVVNELFSIFQKLYGANPESMGPMFEQYFRNSTQLVLEDPESGSTLLDISRVMADSMFRRMKLEKAKNPVVVQFWTQIANKAGGDASLENIVPYIVSKIDTFTANDYMRPIIGQQTSALRFREIIDTKKILLINLSKGRLGEINANLIGMIIVGKLLMAALSRSDAIGTNFPPFYLYIDEFQNITTNSISSILSEARKYKLSLTVAHQFIAQLDEKIRDAVFGNVGSLALFRVGSDDAQALEKQITPIFSANDLMNVENRNAYMRIIARGVPTMPFSMQTMDLPKPDLEYARELIEYSVMKHGALREDVEASIRARYDM